MRRLGQMLLVLIGAAGLLLGAIFFANSQSAVHEIEALICFLIGAVGIGLGTVSASVEAVRDEIEVSTKLRAGAVPPPMPRAQG